MWVLSIWHALLSSTRISDLHESHNPSIELCTSAMSCEHAVVEGRLNQVPFSSSFVYCVKYVTDDSNIGGKKL